MDLILVGLRRFVYFFSLQFFQVVMQSCRFVNIINLVQAQQFYFRGSVVVVIGQIFQGVLCCIFIFFILIQCYLFFKDICVVYLLQFLGYCDRFDLLFILFFVCDLLEFIQQIIGLSRVGWDKILVIFFKYSYFLIFGFKCF